ncbi:hypothetical protein FB567DRAFT_532581 [Paraphoma chrysanthemicola]|uniref:Uncharacterized protein n=1 Tax=Paraphoma chrysanthemicola TaxID=798071 RepID=A0A8K0QZU4_9PLEO|nr:hypothetical protein FB567DRAFT_532581 [Paraphoma chrysanthemicola]
MARSHSSYTASPTRSRSPRRSPARRPSKDGSEYEMDLDALGLNSTFESTELQGSHDPPVDRVDTSDIEGPEDFTMNMTYWMTADLPLAQIKSRKEAAGRRGEIRMDAMHDEGAAQDTPEEGDRVVVAETASPAKRATGTTDERTYSTPASERSMENDEKVRSFLSALPDTDMEGAIAGTPLHMPKHSFLQVPRSSPPKARSLQPTVEDYDTPRKPTQETVIHHTSAVIENAAAPSLHDQIASLQTQLQHQELASKTRILELETILSYTRSELDGARADNYKHTEKVANLEKSIEQQRIEASKALLSAEDSLRAREQALDAKMLEYGEEMRLQTLAKLENQREDFNRQLEALEKSKQFDEVESQHKAQTLTDVLAELDELRDANERRQKEDQLAQQEDREAPASKEHAMLSEQLSIVEARANTLQAELEKATAAAKTFRQDAESREAARHAAAAESRTRSARVFELETTLQSTKFELECAQTDVAAKQQLFRTNLDLNSRIRALEADLSAARTNAIITARNDPNITELNNRISTLQHQLKSAHADISTKDRETVNMIAAQEELERRMNTGLGRTEVLQQSVTSLRQQLAEAHREAERSRALAEQYEHELKDVRDRLQDAHSEADRRVTNLEQRLSKTKDAKAEAERKFKELQSQHCDLTEGHQAMMDDVRDKAEDAVRKASMMLEQERLEKKRVIRDLQRSKADLENARADIAQRDAELERSNDGETSLSPMEAKEKDAEIASLRNIIRKQVTETKSLRIEITAMRKDNGKLRAAMDSHNENATSIKNLKGEVDALHAVNTLLQSRLEDQEAINAAMDKQLASMLSKLMKEKAKTVIGKRDEQWQDNVGQMRNEKELLGRVLLRQWGREELGIADEKQGERQTYQYQHLKGEKT